MNKIYFEYKRINKHITLVIVKNEKGEVINKRYLRIVPSRGNYER